MTGNAAANCPTGPNWEIKAGRKSIKLKVRMTNVVTKVETLNVNWSVLFQPSIAKKCRDAIKNHRWHQEIQLFKDELSQEVNSFRKEFLGPHSESVIRSKLFSKNRKEISLAIA